MVRSRSTGTISTSRFGPVCRRLVWLFAKPREFSCPAWHNMVGKCVTAAANCRCGHRSGLPCRACKRAGARLSGCWRPCFGGSKRQQPRAGCANSHLLCCDQRVCAGTVCCRPGGAGHCCQSGIGAKPKQLGADRALRLFHCGRRVGADYCCPDYPCPQWSSCLGAVATIGFI